MQARSKVVFVLAVIFALAGLEKGALAGLIMEQIAYKEGTEGKWKTTTYIQDNRLKQALNNMPYASAIIYDFNNGDVTLIYAEKNSYVTLERSEFLRDIEKQMVNNKQDSIDNISVRNLTIKKSDNDKKIAGLDTIKYEVFDNNKLMSEYWVTKDATVTNEIDLDKWSALQIEIAEKSQSILGSNVVSDKMLEIIKEIYKGGYPVKTVQHSLDSDEVIIEEVVNVKSQDIPEVEFQAPTGMQKKTYDDIMKMSE